jgi:hypothetical protein
LQQLRGLNLSGVTSSSKLTNTHNKNKNKDSIDDIIITINEKGNLTKQQYQVLKIICDTYEISFSEYIQQAIVEAMRFDIEEGSFSEALLEKIRGQDSKNDKSSRSSVAQGLRNNDLDLL